jgi:hypothetical protein
VAVAANNTDNVKRMLKKIGGSRSDDWNDILASQTVETLWLSTAVLRRKRSKSAPPSRHWPASVRRTGMGATHRRP